MNPGLIHDNMFDYAWSLICDLMIFMIKSIYFFAETVFLTLLPNRLRKMKVSWKELEVLHALSEENK